MGFRSLLRRVRRLRRHPLWVLSTTGLVAAVIAAALLSASPDPTIGQLLPDYRSCGTVAAPAGSVAQRVLVETRLSPCGTTASLLTAFAGRVDRLRKHGVELASARTRRQVIRTRSGRFRCRGDAASVRCTGPEHRSVRWQRAVPYLGVNNAQVVRAGLVQPGAFYAGLTGMGGNVLREDVDWANVQAGGPNSWSWAPIDREINAAPPGVGVILLLLGSPRWALDWSTAVSCGAAVDSCDAPPAEARLGAWREFVSRAVTRYRDRLVGVEVWNEENRSLAWKPRPDPVRYGRLVLATAQATRAVAPDLPVVIGGLSMGDTTNANPVMPFDQFLQSAYAGVPGLADVVSGIGIHPYPRQEDPRPEDSAFHQEMQAARAARDRVDPSASLWVTEVGYHTRGPGAVSPSDEADWLLAILAELDASPDVAATIVHTLFDPVYIPDPSESSYGLLNADGSPKQVWEALHATYAPQGPAAPGA